MEAQSVSPALSVLEPSLTQPQLNDYALHFDDHYMNYAVGTEPTVDASAGYGSNNSMDSSSASYQPGETVNFGIEASNFSCPAAPTADYSYDYGLDQASSGYYSTDNYSLIPVDQQQQQHHQQHNVVYGCDYQTDNLEKYQAAFVSALEGGPSESTPVVADYQYQTDSYHHQINYTEYSGDYVYPDDGSYSITTCVDVQQPPVTSASVAVEPVTHHFDSYDIRIDPYPHSHHHLNHHHHHHHHLHQHQHQQQQQPLLHPGG